MGISWSQRLEGHNQNIVDHGQFEIHSMAVMCLGVVHILPNTVICMGRHALLVLGSPQRQDDGAHAL